MAIKPLLLAGPIVRRVEPRLVSVWVALRDACSVELKLWEGDITSTSEAGKPVATGETPFDAKSAGTIRIGDKLHIALVTWEGSDTKFLKSGTRYAYNVSMSPKAGGPAADLSSLGLLKRDLNATPPVEALGYTDKMLPTFVTVPDDLVKLKIAHGSCRKTFGVGEDGLAFLDRIIKDQRTTIEQRPQQLFLTGDQIYADEVAEMLLPAINAVGQELIGKSGNAPRERIALTVPGEEQQFWPADLVHFPAARRQKLTQEAAKFTSTSAASHLLTFGEFCAMYLFVWSNALWPETLTPKEVLYADPGGGVPPTHNLLTPIKDENLSDKDKELFQGLVRLKEAYGPHEKEVERFRKALPKVRRVLANVATYMIHDDHEITDDWYLTDLWRHEVLLTTFGRYILGNALTAYGLFQAWGNNPKAFIAGKNKDFLDKTQELFPPDTDGPADAVHAALQNLCGMVNDPLAAPDDFVKWYFTIEGPRHQVIALDTRNWRKGRSLYSPPALIPKSMLEKQITGTTRPTGKEVTFVVSAVPVLGLPTIEEVIQKAFILSLDMAQALGKGVGAADKDPEPWSYDPFALEDLLERLAGHERIIFLSGDVHYALSADMDYYQKGTDGQIKAKTRFIQLTASAFKNVEHKLITLASVPIAQFVFENLEAPLARLVWNEDDPAPVTPPAGGRLPAKHRNHLEQSPVLLGTKGWPEGTTVVRLPDRAWRFRLARDGRPDGQRPEPIRHLTLPADFDPAGPPEGTMKAYADMLARHQHSLRRSDPRLVLFDSNLGVAGFEKANSLTLSASALSQLEADGNLGPDILEPLQALEDRPILEENFRTVLKAHLGVERSLTTAQMDAIKAKATNAPDVLAVRHRLFAVHPEKPDVPEVYTQQIFSLQLTTEPAPTLEIPEEQPA